MNEKKQEVDLLGLFWAIMRQWRKIIKWMIICGIVFAVVKLGLGLIALSDKEEVDRQIKEYNILVENKKQAKIASRDKMDTLTEQLNAQREYLDNSVYMSVDPYRVHRATARYFVKTNYEIMPDKVYQNIDRTGSIVNTYVAILTNEDFLTDLANQMNTELRFLQEILSVYNAGDGVLGITVTGENDVRTNQIMEYVIAGIESQKNTVEDTIDEFTITRIGLSNFTTVDNGMVDAQQAAKDRLTGLMEAYSEEQEHFEEIDEIEIKEPGVTFSALIKGIIKFGIIGVVIGIVLVGVIAAVKYISGNEVYSAKLLGDRYESPVIVKLTAVVNKKVNKLDMAIRNHEDRIVVDTYDEDNSIQLMASYIDNVTKEGDKLLLIGELGTQKMNSLSEKLSKKLSRACVCGHGSIISDSEVVKKCSEADRVVLVEECGKSRYSDITKEIDLVKTYNLDMLGFAVYED